MINRIFIIGQCTLHWGRMEFGNIGNYYIIEPFFIELKRNFPSAIFVTTMQFSDEFCKKFNIDTVPMELYYDFSSDCNLYNAKTEYQMLLEDDNFNTPYIQQVRKSDFVIDFSGDIWGDNADFLGKDRFATGCYKDLTAQMLKPTVMMAGSPGPFSPDKNLDLARQTYAGFTFVTNREPISTRLLKSLGFDVSKTNDYPCPSFLFEKSNNRNDIPQLSKENENQLLVGFMLCGWNFKRGPFDTWPRTDEEYDVFRELLIYLIKQFKAKIVLLSHSNGFDVPPKPFVLKHGRDYPILEQLKKSFNNTEYDKNIRLLDGIYTPAVTKAIVSQFDVLISGRMHGAVSGLSQSIPTLIIDYGHEPKAHKLRGFAEVVIDEQDDIIADPNNIDDLINKSTNIINNRTEWHSYLQSYNKHIKTRAQEQFVDLADVIDS